MQEGYQGELAIARVVKQLEMNLQDCLQQVEDAEMFITKDRVLLADGSGSEEARFIGSLSVVGSAAWYCRGINCCWRAGLSSLLFSFALATSQKEENSPLLSPSWVDLHGDVLHLVIALLPIEQQYRLQ